MNVRRILASSNLYRSWIWPKKNHVDLAGFVNAECAAAATPPLRLGDGRSINDAVESGDRHAVAAAIYELIAELQIDYDRAGYVAGPQSVQRVRTPLEIVQQRRATCLDLTLLYAGMALNASLKPIVVLLDGHALPALVNVDDDYVHPLDATGQMPLEAIRAWIADERLLAVESTGAARGKALDYDFDQAMEIGREEVVSREIVAAIDPGHLQREGGIPIAECRVLSPFRVAGLALILIVLVAAAGVGAFRILKSLEVPVFASEIDGIAVAEIDGSEDLGHWLARSLAESAERDRLVDVGNCNVVSNEVRVWDPSTTARASLQDQSNPSNVDLVLSGRVVPGDGGGRRLVELSVLPFAAEVRGAADPVFLFGLPTIPAVVDQERTALDNFPELVTLPAIITGLRELEAGTANGIGRAGCLFDLAEQTLVVQEGETPRILQFLASIDLLRANVHVRLASGFSEDQETAHLIAAQSAVDSARLRLGESDMTAIVDANGVAIDMMGLITDSGTLQPDVDERQVLATIADYRAVAEAASSFSDSAYIAIRTMEAKLALSAARQFGTSDFLEIAKGSVADAVKRAESTDDSAINLYAAESYRVEGLVHMVNGDVSLAVDSFAQAASLTENSDHYRSLLREAGARSVRCTDDDAARIAAIFEQSRQYVEATGDVGVGTLLEQTTSAVDCDQ